MSELGHSLPDPKFISYLRKKYSPVPSDETEKILEAIQSIQKFVQDRTQNIKSIMEQVGRTIYRLFGFKEIGIGLKDEKDGVYRYIVLIGYRKEVESAYRKLEYTYEDMLDNAKYPNIKIGKITEFMFVEGLPSDEEIFYTYNRPSELNRKRESFENFMEGDYIDFFMKGYNDKILGFIEVGNTMDGKLPSCSSIRWIEAITSICAIIIQRNQNEKRR